MASKKKENDIMNLLSGMTKSLASVNSGLTNLESALTPSVVNLKSFSDALSLTVSEITKQVNNLKKTSVIPTTPPPTTPPPTTPPPTTPPPASPDNTPENAGDDQRPKGAYEPTDFLKFSAIIGALTRVADTISSFQAETLSLGFTEAADKISIGLGDTIPAITEIKTASTLLKTGLDTNAEGIGKYIARSELLGKDSVAFANSIKSFSTTLSLTNDQQTTFVKTISDASLIYKASSEELAASVAQFADQIAITTLAGNTTTVEAFGSLEAEVQRFLPENTLQKFFGPLLAGQSGIRAETSFLGIEEEVRRLSSLQNIQGAEASRGDLLKIVQQVNEVGKTFGANIEDARDLRTQLAQIFPNLGEDVFVVARQIADALEKSTPDLTAPPATVEQTTVLLRTLGDRLLEPLALAGFVLLNILESLGGLSKYILSGVITAAFIRGFLAIKTFLADMSSKLSQIAANTAASAATPAIAGGAAPVGATAARGAAARGAASAAPATGLLGSMKNMFTSFGSKLTSFFSFSGLRTALSGALRGIFSFLGGPIGVVATLASFFLPMLFSSSEKTADNTKKLADNITTKSTLSTNELELSNRAAVINRLMEVDRSMKIAQQVDDDPTKTVLQEQANSELTEIKASIKELSQAMTRKSMMRKT